MKPMIIPLLLSSLLSAPSQMGSKLELVVSQGGGVLSIAVLNAGDQEEHVDKVLSLHSLVGNLELQVSKNGTRYPKVAEGTGPSMFENERIALPPSYLYGVSIPLDYVRRSYGLAAGCYSVIANLRMDAEEGGGKLSISSDETRICFT